MARSPNIRNIDELMKEIDDELARFGGQYPQMSLRSKVQALASLSAGIADLGVSTVVREHGFPRNAALDRIKVYLVAHVGVTINGEELAIVAGILDYARRVRQLRVEDGYAILTGASNDEFFNIELKPDEYLLVSAEPDHTAARRWRLANRIRKSDQGSRAKIREFLLHNVGQIVSTEELVYVANDAREFGRRTRELRTEEGYAVSTKHTGRPDLSPGQYVLESARRIAEPHDRHIPDDIQKAVYERDEHRCQNCGWTRLDWTAADARILELHHRKMHRDRGQSTLKNLVVLCSVCHDKVHAGELPQFVDRE